MNRAILASVFVFLLLCPAVIRAGLVVDHPGIQSGGPASDTLFVDSAGLENWQQLADDFTFSAAGPTTIRRVSWLGFYGSSFESPPPPPPQTETFRIRFYLPRLADGLPGNVFFEDTIADPARTPTGQIIGVGAGPPEFSYQVDLATPLSLQPDTPYWIEIVQLGGLDSHFRWENAFVDQSGHAFKNSAFPDWQLVAPGDLAFSLSTIPEPQTLALIIFGVAMLSRKPSVRQMKY